MAFKMQKQLASQLDRDLLTHGTTNFTKHEFQFHQFQGRKNIAEVQYSYGLFGKPDNRTYSQVPILGTGLLNEFNSHFLDQSVLIFVNGGKFSKHAYNRKSSVVVKKNTVRWIFF